MTGYSGTPLAKKLGYTEGARIALLNAPDGYSELVAPWPAGVDIRTTLRGGPFRVVHLFAPDAATLRRRFDACRNAIERSGAFWVSWPKRSSGVPTDLTEDVVRDLALERGLVDVKVAAVDATWSALKLVYRLADR